MSTGRTLADSSPELAALGFLRLLWEIHHGLSTFSKRMQRDIGLTGPQRLVLRLLGESPGMTPGELAESLHLDPSTLTGIVRRLQRGRFVRRAVDPLDRRRHLLAVTPRARAATSVRTGTVEERVAGALGALSAREIESTKRGLLLVAKELRIPRPKTRVSRLRQ